MSFVIMFVLILLYVFLDLSMKYKCGNKSVSLVALIPLAKGGWVSGAFGGLDFFPNSQKVKSLRA